jgi:peptide deformylase
MAIRKIVTVGGPKESVLHTKAKRISRFDEHLERLVADLWETMRAAPGVGLAAPQVGESIRVLVAEYEEQAVALVNPEIIKSSEETVFGTEGCLSIPGFVGDNVERSEAVVVKARNPKGTEIRIRAEGWFARILQHEIDHLNGVLYTDRIKPEDIRPVREEDLEQAAEGAPTEGHTEAQAGTNGVRPAGAKPDAKTAKGASRVASEQETAQGAAQGSAGGLR